MLMQCAQLQAGGVLAKLAAQRRYRSAKAYVIRQASSFVRNALPEQFLFATSHSQVCQSSLSAARSSHYWDHWCIVHSLTFRVMD